ncbi:MAG TPA: G5 domain-containing protein [Candidatus Moranbacteria bacterium]|nr:G5 domain-containing protein [Candidatus Moranbacteria bacterium]
MNKKKFKKIFYFLLLFTLIFGAYKLFLFFKNKRDFSENSEYRKTIILNDNGLIFETSTSAGLVSEFLKDKNINLGEHDKIIPELDSKIFSGSNIEIQRAAKIKIEVDGKKIEGYAISKNVGKALIENNITLTRLDKTEPRLSYPVENNSTIIVTRINIEEKIEKEEIDFKITAKNDSKLGWREKKVEQKGEKGIKEIKYEITYKNGKEISRKVLEKNITKEPIAEIIVKGTYVKLGKTHTGLGTWYKQPEHLFIGSESGEGLYAANPWLPKGSYVKVTNKDNGKTVIVRINDRGPFGPNRIIDLHTVAFQKIASLGAGVINVKMEEILN